MGVPPYWRYWHYWRYWRKRPKGESGWRATAAGDGSRRTLPTAKQRRM